MSVKKLHENKNLENKKESLRSLFYKIPEFIFIYEGMHNSKNNNSKSMSQLTFSKEP